MGLWLIYALSYSDKPLVSFATSLSDEFTRLIDFPPDLNIMAYRAYNYCSHWYATQTRQIKAPLALAICIWHHTYHMINFELIWHLLSGRVLCHATCFADCRLWHTHTHTHILQTPNWKLTLCDSLMCCGCASVTRPHAHIYGRLSCNKQTSPTV